MRDLLTDLCYRDNEFKSWTKQCPYSAVSFLQLINLDDGRFKLIKNKLKCPCCKINWFYNNLTLSI